MNNYPSRLQIMGWPKLALIGSLGLLLAVPRGQAITRSWLGTAGNSYWSTAANWTPAGQPQNGDALNFTNHVSTFITNDIVGLSVQSLNFYSGFTVAGNSLTVGGGLSNEGIYYHGTDLTMAMNNAGVTLSDLCTFSASSLNTALVLNCPINLNGFGLDAESFNGATVQFQNAIFGNGDFFAGSGTNWLIPINVNNTFTGPVRVGGGTLNVGGVNGYAVPSLLRVYGTGTVILSSDNSIAPSASVVITGGGQFLLNGYSDTVSNLVMTNDVGDTVASTVDTGSGQLGLNGGVTAWLNNDTLHSVIKGKLNLNGYLPFDIGGGPGWGLEIQAVISGNGFSKTGNGGLLLRGNNTFFGDVGVNAGTVEATTATAFGQAGPTYGVHIAGGTVQLSSVAIGAEPLFVDAPSSPGLIMGGTCSWAGPVTLNADLVMAVIDTMDFSGAISGTGGIHLNGGGGTLLLDGTAANTFTGSLSLCEGLIELGKPSGVNACSGPLVVGPPCGQPCEVRWLNSYQNVGATLTVYAGGLVNLTNHNDDFGPVTFNGGEVDTGTNGQFGVYQTVTVNPSINSALITGVLGLPLGAYPNNKFVVVGGAGDTCDLVIDANIIGDGILAKYGAGALCLVGSNSYTGATFVYAGTLSANSPNALGTSGVGQGTTVYTGATLRMSPAATLNEPISISGSGVNGTNGALDVIGTVTLHDLSPSIFPCLDLVTDATVRVEVGGLLIADGFIDGTGPLRKTGPGAMEMTGVGNNTYTGDTIVTEGTLYLYKSQNVLAVPQNLIIGPAPASSSAVALLGSSGVMGGTVATVNANSALNLFGNNLLLSQLTLNDGGSVTTGAGALDLTGGATISVGSLSPSGSHVSSSIAGNIGLPPNDSVSFSVNPYAIFFPFGTGPELDVPATIFVSGPEQQNQVPAGFTKTGQGNMRLSGSNSFKGSVFVNGGSLIASSSTALGTTDNGTFVNNNAMLVLDSGVPGVLIGGETLYLNTTHSPALDSRNGLNYWTGPIVLSLSSAINVDNYLAAGGVISGTGNLTKLGSGTLDLDGSGYNSYSGDTLVNQGTLLLNKPLAVTAVPGPLEVGLADGSSFATARNYNSYQVIGNIYVHTGSLLDIDGQTENVDYLSLDGNAAVQTGTGMLELKTGADIGVSPGPTNAPATITGNIGLDPGNHHLSVASGGSSPGLVVYAAMSETGGAASIEAPGPGVVSLNGNNSYQGFTYVSGGTLIAASATALGSSASGTLVLNNATLALDSGPTNSGIAFNNEALSLNSSAAIALDSRNGSNTWSGPITNVQSSGINVAGSGYLLALNTISGSGGLTKLGSGTLRLWGFVANTYSGLTTVSQGMLEAGRVNLTSVPGDIVVGDDTTSTTVATLRTDREQQFSRTANITVRASGLFDVYPYPGVPVPVPTIRTVVGTGLMNLGAGTSLTVSNDVTCAFNGQVSGPGVLNKTGSATLQLTGANTYTGTTTISAGVLQVDGTQLQSPVVVSGGTIQGTGTVGLIDTTASTAVASPGDGGPGMLTCSNLNGGGNPRGTLQVLLNGATPGTGYSQLNVHGAVTLSTGGQHTMALNASLGFASWLSNSFTIINNDGNDAIVGTFQGLAQNATLTIGSQQFQISYTGGDGNDVVLTQISGFPRPALMLQTISPSSVRLLWQTNDSAYTLLSSTNLATTNWTTATPAPVVLGTNYVVTNASTGAQKFYRLSKP